MFYQQNVAFVKWLFHCIDMKLESRRIWNLALGKRVAAFWTLLFLALVLFPQTGFPANLQDKTVRVVYLVSQDRQVRPDFQLALEKAIRELQQWYGQQLNGSSFRLHDPVVEVAHVAQHADWFYSHPNGNNQDDWGFNNTLAEANRLVRAEFNDPHYIWVIYSDGPGNKGRGTSGVCCLPEDDLLGLVGQHPTQKKIARWVGGLGHELGHAFGLPHPTDAIKDADAIMWAGFYDQYPGKAYLTESDKKILLRSPFFFDAGGNPVAGSEVFAEKYTYPGGFFGKLADKTPSQWKERKIDSSAVFTFDELLRDASVIRLNDASRGITIELPIIGGQSRLSTDDGATWHPLYQVSKE
jgi:hypothetical protein